MVNLVAVGALVAGSAGDSFFAEPVAVSERMRNDEMGALAGYGILVLVAGLVFRANFWGIRGTGSSSREAEVFDPERG